MTSWVRSGSWHGASRDVLLARGLHWPDGGPVVQRIDTHGRPIVFVANQAPPRHLWPALPPPVIALSTVARLVSNVLELNLADVAAVVSETDAANQRVQPMALTAKQPQQAFRKAAAEVLRSALRGDEYVQAYLENGSYGEAARALAARYGIAISKDAVARAVQRRGGPPAVKSDYDSSSVRRTVASQPCDRKRKFAAPPQHPESE